MQSLHNFQCDYCEFWEHAALISSMNQGNKENCSRIDLLHSQEDRDLSVWCKEEQYFKSHTPKGKNIEKLSHLPLQ
jgi:hypothetical protein